MRLLVLTTSFPSPAYPASGIYIQRMLYKLPMDVRTTVLSPACDRRIDPPCEPQGIKVKQIRYAPYPLQILAHKPGGIPAALSEHPWAWAMIPIFSAAMLSSAVVHGRKAELIHAQWSFSGLIAGLAGRLIGTPSITTLRGSDVRLANQSRIFRKIIQWCVKLNDQVVMVGQDMADQVRQWVPPSRKRIIVIPNGVDDAFWATRMKSTSENVVIVIGNLIVLKKVDVVIRAFESLAGMDDRLRLMIVGAGPELARLQSMVRSLSIGDRVEFTGLLPPDQVAEKISQSAMLVLASAGEGRPNVILEAMAAGVPVVASDIDGARELITNGERGLLFPVGDFARLAGCIKCVLDNPDLGRRLADRALQWVQSQGLTWERTAQRYAERYHQVIAEHRRKSGKRSCAE